MATKADEFCREILDKRERANYRNSRGKSPDELYRKSNNPVTIQENRALCDKDNALMPQLVGDNGNETGRLIAFMKEHEIGRVYLDTYFDRTTYRHHDRISGKIVTEEYSKISKLWDCPEGPSNTSIMEGFGGPRTGCLEIPWEGIKYREDIAFMLTENGTIEALQPGAYDNQKAWAVCQSKPSVEITSSRDIGQFMKEQCWRTVAEVRTRADRYEKYLDDLFRAYKVAQGKSKQPAFSYDSNNSTSRPKRDTYTEETVVDWRAGNIAVGVLENFIPIVGPAFTRAMLDQLMAESIDHRKYVKQLQGVVKDVSVTVKEMIVGHDNMQDQMEDMYRVAHEMREELQNLRAESHIGLMLQSVDEASRSLDASARGAANEFEDLISAVMNQQTPVSLWSFREIESLQEAATKTDYERICPQHSEMLSFVIPSGDQQILSILTRVPIQGRASELYETIPLAHATAEHGMVRPVLQHRFILTSGREYQVLTESEVRKCLGKACVLTGEVRIASAEDCGIPLAIQRGVNNCPLQSVPTMNYLDSSFDRKHLLYSVTKPLTLELYCPLEQTRPVSIITVSQSGLLDVPAGCKFVDSREHVTYFGPVGTTKSLFSVQDSRKFNLNYQAETVILSSDMPVIPIADFERTHIRSEIRTFEPVPDAPRDYTYVGYGVAMGVIVLVCLVAMCCFLQWKKKLIQTTSGLGAELAALAGRVVASASSIGSRQPSREGLDEPFISNELAIYDPSRGSPPNERRDAYATHRRAPRVDLETGIVKGIRRLSSFMPVPTSPEAARAPSPLAKAPFSPSASVASTRKVQFAAKGRSRQAWPESATDDASDVSDSDATAGTVLEAKRTGTKQKYAPSPNIDEFMRQANLSIEPSRDFPPPAPERNSSVVPSSANSTFSHSPSGLRRYPPATRASQQDDVEHVPSLSPSRHTRNASVSLPPTSPGMSRYARSDSVSLPPPPPALPAQSKQ
jgi:hypothetical protein